MIQLDKIVVDLQPVGKRVAVEPGTTLLDAARQAGVDLVAACGGVGVCATCLVRHAGGELSPLTETEQHHLDDARISAGFRLACEAVPLGDVRIEIPPESLPVAQKLQVEGEDSGVELDPAVAILDLSIPAPSQEDLRSDFTRVRQAVSARDESLKLQPDRTAVNMISGSLREQDWAGRVVVRRVTGGENLVAILPPGSACLGLAVDMGSTKLAVYLVDLLSGATLASAGVMNPQISYGEDVVSRIAYANRDEKNRRLLQRRLVETLNKTIATLCRQVGVSPRQVTDAVMVGNTVMHHLFCGLPVSQLGAAPYVPAVSEPFELRAAEVGLDLAPGAWVYLPANIAGYVGADHTSALLASGAEFARRSMLLVDIGTNTEISLVRSGRIYTCSTASGPAFEGAHIHDGMRASAGAIDKVRIHSTGVEVDTIANAPAVGICGTGILNAISEMLAAGIVDRRGVMRKGGGAPWFNARGEFVLVPAERSGHGREVVVTRKDINEIQLAKGAIRAGIEILLAEAGIPAQLVERWVIAGAFGTYLDLNSAVRVGMFPLVPNGAFRQVGNAAGMGAKQMLLSRRKRVEALRLARRANYIELTACAEFTPKFMEEMYFPVHDYDVG
jgi:uncharacterized 2Fe-2S/4Fe-4S cluster protein (DUF4445 family)